MCVCALTPPEEEKNKSLEILIKGGGGGGEGGRGVVLVWSGAAVDILCPSGDFPRD